MSEVVNKQQRCIYVGDLHENTNKEDLTQVFSQHGAVSSVMIFCAVLRKKYAQVEMVDQQAGMISVFIQISKIVLRLFCF